MEAFTTLHSVAAPLPEANIDTDVIFPGRFLLITEKAGLGRHAFHDKRWRADGSANADFVLNQPPFDRAQIVVAGDNFGCGSSREQAPWALRDFGIRCLISTRFGEIFRSNCANNGMLALAVPADEHARLMAVAQRGRMLTVDLVRCRVEWPGDRGDTEGLAFAIPEAQRDALLAGRDEIDTILAAHGRAIGAFEAAQRQRMPWL